MRLGPPHAHSHAHSQAGFGTYCAQTGEWRPRAPHETQPKTAAQQRVGYTLWNIAFLVLSLFFAALALYPPFTTSTYLRTVASHVLCTALCSSVGVAVSFHVGMFLGGREAVLRLQLHNDLPHGVTFWLYNGIAHLVPLLVLYYAVVVQRKDQVEAVHGLWAAVLHFGWGLLETDGTLLLDAVYTELWPWQWHLTWACALAAEIFAAPAWL